VTHRVEARVQARRVLQPVGPQEVGPEEDH
jgi:hypothetical protein